MRRLRPESWTGPRAVGACVLSFAFVAGAGAQSPERGHGGAQGGRPVPVEYLTGTLAKVYRSGRVAVGYRASSIPFSFIGPREQPVGYSIDICRLLVERMSAAVATNLEIDWVLVTSESRLRSLVNGLIDVECGSTTVTREREEIVSFSPAVFISGAKLMVRKGSPIRGFEDLSGKNVVYTAGTTGEQALKAKMANEGLKPAHLVQGPDHEESWRILESGKADAFVNDDVLLYGLIAQHRASDRFEVVGDFLSYEPYGIAYRRNDAGMMRLVDSLINDLAANRGLENLYAKWFLSDLPAGARLDLPMSLQLRELLRTMGGDKKGRSDGRPDKAGGRQ